jgi:hypothetical protein
LLRSSNTKDVPNHTRETMLQGAYWLIGNMDAVCDTRDLRSDIMSLLDDM